MISLTRRVCVDSFVALADIGVPSQKEEILAVLKLAELNQGVVSAAQINVRLLDRPAESPHGTRILMVIESYGLITKSDSSEVGYYRITSAGLENLKKGEIMIPEQGSYVLYTTTDPIFSEPILKIERNPYVERDESQGFFGNKKDQEWRMKSTRTVEKPAYLTDVIPGYVLKQACDEDKLVQINMISDKMIESRKTIKAEVTVELLPEKQAQMIVKTSDDSGKQHEVYTQTNFSESYLSVLKSLTRNVGSLEVIENVPTLFVNWKDVRPVEAEQFLKRLIVEKPTFPKFGDFDRLEISIPIFPATQPDAVQWADYLLQRTITTYVDEPQYNGLRNMVASKFARKYDPNALAKEIIHFEDMLRKLTDQKLSGVSSETYWYLLAPKDLSVK